MTKLTEQQKEKRIIALQNQMKKEYFTVLDVLYEVCDDSAKSFNSIHIPLSVLKHHIEATKKSIAKGMKNARRTTGK